MSITDVPTIKKRLAKTGVLDSVTDWLIMEGLSHDSVDNTPQGISRAIMKLYHTPPYANLRRINIPPSYLSAN